MDRDRSNETPDASTGPDARQDAPGPGRPTIDMAAFEALLVGAAAPALDPRDDDYLRLAQQRQPVVEWAIAWTDGRFTPVDSEAAAHVVTARYPACQIACRIVGPWGPP